MVSSSAFLAALGFLVEAVVQHRHARGVRGVRGVLSIVCHLGTVLRGSLVHAFFHPLVRGLVIGDTLGDLDDGFIVGGVQLLERIQDGIDDK